MCMYMRMWAYVRACVHVRTCKHVHMCICAHVLERDLLFCPPLSSVHHVETISLRLCFLAAVASCSSSRRSSAMSLYRMWSPSSRSSSSKAQLQWQPKGLFKVLWDVCMAHGHGHAHGCSSSPRAFLKSFGMCAWAWAWAWAWVCLQQQPEGLFKVLRDGERTRLQVLLLVLGTGEHAAQIRSCQGQLAICGQRGRSAASRRLRPPHTHARGGAALW